MIRFHRIALLAALAVTATTGARADIVTALSAAPTLTNGVYAYKYNVELAGSSQLIGTQTNDRDGTLAGNRQFGTVYDFGPMIQNATGGVRLDVTGLLTGFTFTFNATDVTGPGAVDSPSLNNIRFTYAQTNSLIYIEGQTPSPPAMTATAQTVDGSDVANLGTFTVYSAYGPTTNNSLSYDGASFKSTNNTLQTNAGIVSGPLQPSTAVPEPASLALLGAGLVGLGMVRRRKDA